MLKLLAIFVSLSSFSAFAQESQLCLDLYNSGRSLLLQAKTKMEQANKKLISANEQDELSKECDLLAEAYTLRRDAIRQLDKGHKAMEGAYDACNSSANIASINQNKSFAADNIRSLFKANDAIAQIASEKGCE